VVRGISGNNNPISCGASQDTQVSKHARVEGILLTRCSKRALEICSENSINLHHLNYRRLAPIPHERAAQFPKNTTHCAVVNVSVSPIKITQRLLDSVGQRFADNPRMAGLIDTHGQPKFKRHVESRRSRTLSIELNPRQIVNRVLRVRDKGPDSFQASFAGRNFEGSARLESESAEASDVGQQQILEAVVVGDI
jgi:hypothetical protein